MFKWRLEDGSVRCLCVDCSKKKYEKLVIRLPWKVSDAGKKVTCEECGEATILQREGKV